MDVKIYQLQQTLFLGIYYEIILNLVKLKQKIRAFNI